MKLPVEDISAERYRDFLAIANEWFWETDTQHRFVYLSSKLEEISGVPVSAILGLRREEFTADPDAPHMRQHLEDLKAHKPIRDYVYQGGNDLNRQWFRISGNPFYDAQGRFCGYRGTGIDITEIVQTEERARKAQSQLDLALKSTNEGVALYGTDDRLIFANERFYEFFDPDREVALPGLTFTEVMTRFVEIRRVQSAAANAEEWLSKRLAGHAAGSYDAEVDVDNGRSFKISEHKIVGVGTIGVYAEITDRVRREHEMKQQSRLMNSVFSNVSQGLCIVDTDLRIIVANGRFNELLDIPEEMSRPGKPYSDVFRYNLQRDEYPVGQDKNLVSRSMELLGSKEAFRYQRRRPNGTVLEVEMVPLPGGGTILAISDVTERDRILADLEEREQRYRMMVEKNPDAILIHRDNRVLFANAQSALTFGASSNQDMVGMKATRLIHPDDIERINQDVSEMLKEGIGSHRGSRTYSAVRLNGDIFEMETESSLIAYDGKAAVQVIARDVTARRQAEEAMLRAKDEAEMANRAKSEFLANMSHELRTPLNAVIGFSEILQAELFGPLGNDRYKGYVNDIRDSGAHLLQVINDILDLSKAEAGQVDLNEAIFDIDAPIASAMRLVSDGARAKNISLTVQTPDEPILIRADERLIKQIMLNLLSNAVKFTNEDGRIAVTCRTDENGLTIAIEDNGIGMREDEIERMFEVFQQANTGLDRKYEGTGLGLPLSKSLAELHGGRITLTSTFGAGTVASLILPLERIQQG